MELAFFLRDVLHKREIEAKGDPALMLPAANDNKF